MQAQTCQNAALIFILYSKLRQFILIEHRVPKLIDYSKIIFTVLIEIIDKTSSYSLGICCQKSVTHTHLPFPLDLLLLKESIQLVASLVQGKQYAIKDPARREPKTMTLSQFGRQRMCKRFVKLVST